MPKVIKIKGGKMIITGHPVFDEKIHIILHLSKKEAEKCPFRGLSRDYGRLKVDIKVVR